MNHIDYLQSLGACQEAVNYARGFDSLQAAWDVCERGDWMMWLVARTMDRNDEPQLRKLTLAKGRCAETVIDLMTDERSKNAVRVAIAFGEGRATRQELNDGADADAYAAYAVRKNTPKKCAEIVRAVYPVAPIQEVKQ